MKIVIVATVLALVPTLVTAQSRTTEEYIAQLEAHVAELTAHVDELSEAVATRSDVLAGLREDLDQWAQRSEGLQAVVAYTQGRLDVANATLASVTPPWVYLAAAAEGCLLVNRLTD